MKKVIIILSAVLLFTACKKTDINGSTYYYTGGGPKPTVVVGCKIDSLYLAFTKDTLYQTYPLNKDLQNFSVSSKSQSAFGFSYVSNSFTKSLVSLKTPSGKFEFCK
mgnify:CR=1 FL=1